MNQKLVVMGLGYIGLPTAAMFAMSGMQVCGVDVRPDTVEAINEGRTHIVEPDLDSLVARVVADGNLRAQTTPEPADVFIIAVPTPIRADKTADLEYVFAATDAIAPHLQAGNLIIIESTCPVGATEKVAKRLAKARPDLSLPGMAEGNTADLSLAYCPERVLPGRILEEVVSNDRVIGGMTTYCASQAVRFYKRVVKGDCRITTSRTAEMAKLTENAFRDVNIAFANELSQVADDQKVDVWELIDLANLHPRVNILKPGPGVGGHCIAVDPWFIVEGSPDNSPLIQTARKVNDGKPDWVVQKCSDLIERENLKPVTIACLGLAFKANVDDCRESPAIEIVKQLSKLNDTTIVAVEPHIASLPDELAGCGVELMDTQPALAQADIVILLTDHDAFSSITHDMLRNKHVIDTRGFWRRPR